MPKIECPKCNAKIDSWHPDCPYCSNVIKRNYSKLIIAFVILTLGNGIFYATWKISKQNFIKEKETVQQQAKAEKKIVSESVKKIQPVLIE